MSGLEPGSALWAISWAIIPVFAVERLIHRRYRTPGNRLWAFAFIVYAAGAILAATSCSTPTWGRLLLGAIGLICAVTGGAHVDSAPLRSRDGEPQPTTR